MHEKRHRRPSPEARRGAGHPPRNVGGENDEPAWPNCVALTGSSPHSKKKNFNLKATVFRPGLKEVARGSGTFREQANWEIAREEAGPMIADEAN